MTFRILEHIDGVSISSVCADLYAKLREMTWSCFILEMEQTMHQFILQSKIVSENIKWNLNIKSKKIRSLIS